MHKNKLVIILHGIGHSKWNMLGVEHSLRKRGYKTLNISYPSRQNNMQALRDFVYQRLQQTGIWSQDFQKVHFVTHSMGGLIVRNYLQSYQREIPINKLGRVVMIAPPNKGSELANFLKNFPPYKWIFGPASQELTTMVQSKLIHDLYYELGIVAGTCGWPYILGNICIRDKHDGRVSVESTKLNGMKDHITINSTHSFISWRPLVHKQILCFLENGKFQKI